MRSQITGTVVVAVTCSRSNVSRAIAGSNSRSSTIVDPGNTTSCVKIDRTEPV